MSKFAKRYNNFIDEAQELEKMLEDYRCGCVRACFVGLSFSVSENGICMTDRGDFIPVEELAAYLAGLAEMLGAVKTATAKEET